MVKKRKVELNSIESINQKVSELKIELAKFKGMLASKTKSNNTSKKKQLKKEIARLLTKLNQLNKNNLIKKVATKVTMNISKK
jgi:ribosomal protein L29